MGNSEIHLAVSILRKLVTDGGYVAVAGSDEEGWHQFELDGFFNLTAEEAAYVKRLIEART